MLPLPSLQTAAILLTVRTVAVVFGLDDQLNYMPPARVYTEDTYTVALLNSSYKQIEPDGSSSSIMKSEQGRFADFYVAESGGILVHVVTSNFDDLHTGCSLPWSASVGEIPKHQKWIALVKKGKCNSQTKIQNAFVSNASGIIIYSDKPFSQLERIRQSGSVPKNFSVVFTFRWIDEELCRAINNGTTVYMHISIGEVITKTIARVNKTSVLFVSISFMILMMVSIGWIIFYYVQKCRYLHAKDQLSKRLSSAAKKALQKIPTRHIKADDKDCSNNGCGVVNESCAICIELFKPADVVRLLPCRHEFHKLCIDPWLLEHRTCPMCKMDILKYFGFELTGSQESMLRIDQDDAFHDYFFYNPDPQNVSTIVETSAIVPVTINHYSCGVDVDNCPSTSHDILTPTLSINHQLSEYAVVAAAMTADGNSGGLRLFRNGDKQLQQRQQSRRLDNSYRDVCNVNNFNDIVIDPTMSSFSSDTVSSYHNSNSNDNQNTTTNHNHKNVTNLNRSTSFSNFDYTSGQI